MPKVGQMLESKFLKKEDIGTAALLTVTSCDQRNVAIQGADPELKWCLHFAEIDKPLVLNSTNIKLCEQVFASDDTDDWNGKKVVLYTDPNITYGGKLVGGIRVRKPKDSAAKPAPRSAALPVPEDDDSIPF